MLISSAMQKVPPRTRLTVTFSFGVLPMRSRDRAAVAVQDVIREMMASAKKTAGKNETGQVNGMRVRVLSDPELRGFLVFSLATGQWSKMRPGKNPL